MTAEYRVILRGALEEDPKIFDPIVECLEDIDRFPHQLEPIYREVTSMDETSLDTLRFALVRLQVYADIHRNENMQEAQNLKYVGQVLEKVIFGSLMLERDESSE